MKNKSYLAISILLFSIPNPALSQDLFCHTDEIEIGTTPFSSSGTVLSSGLYESSNFSYCSGVFNHMNFKVSQGKESHLPIHHLKVRIHFVQEDDGSGNFTPTGDGVVNNTIDGPTYAQNLIDAANNHLSSNQAMNLPVGNSTPVFPVRYRFNLVGTSYIQNSDLRNYNNLGTCVDPSFLSTDNVFDVFILDIPNDNTLGGKAGLLPVTGNCTNPHISLVNNWGNHFNGQSAWAYAGIFCHEFGHVLGLRHTWYTYDPATSIHLDGLDYFSEFPDLDSFIAFFNKSNELPCNPNCWDQNSTPVDPGHPLYFDNCHTTCNPHSNNVMDYNNCQCAWTPSQVAYMHFKLWDKFQDFLVDDYCSISEPDIVITGNVVWDFPRRLRSNIVVSNGATLTITCMVGLPSNANIIVQRGAKLIVNGGHITGNCDVTWNSIQVYGTPGLQHNQASGSNGYLEIRNGSVIERGYNAVYTGQVGSGNNNGGLVVAKNSTFYNNRISINIPDYGSIGGIQNKTLIQECTFDCDTGLYNGYGVNHHVAMTSTHGIQIFGNVFKNSAPIQTFTDSFRGRGINCLNSTIYLDASDDPFSVRHPCDYPDGVGNKFEGLTYGIVLADWLPGQSQKTTKILESEFKNCRTGISIDSEGLLKIYKNRFYWDQDNIDDVLSSVEGIHYEGAGAQLEMYENSIEFFPAPHIETSNGMLLSGTSDNLLNSYIYLNQITNYVFPLAPLAQNLGKKQGMQFLLDNRLLEVRCNSFTDLNNDWHISPGTFRDQGGPQQGTNWFSDNSPGSSHVLNIDYGYPVPVYNIYPHPGSITPTFTGGIVVHPGVADNCPVTNPCDMRSNGFNFPGSDNGGEGGGSGIEVGMKEGMYIDREVFQNISDKNYALAFESASKLTSSRKEMHLWFVQHYENKLAINNLSREDIQFLLKYACNGDETGGFATTLLESYTDVPFACRNKRRGSGSSDNPVPGPMDTQLSLILYPNPAATSVSVEFRLSNAGGSGEIYLSDMLGRRFISETGLLDAGSAELDISRLASGTYFVTLRENTGKTLIKKLTIVK